MAAETIGGAVHLDSAYWSDRLRRSRNPEELLVLRIAIRAISDILRPPPKDFSEDDPRSGIKRRVAKHWRRKTREDFDSAWWWIFTEERKCLSFRTFCDAFGIDVTDARNKILVARNGDKRHFGGTVFMGFVDTVTTKIQDFESE